MYEKEWSKQMRKDKYESKTKKDSPAPADAGKTRRAHVRNLIYLFPAGLLAGILLIGASGGAIPDEVYTASMPAARSSETAEGVPADTVGAEPGDTDANVNTFTAKLFGWIPAKTVEGKLPADLKLVPSGDVFGVKFFTKGVIVTAISEVESAQGIISPAAKAGLKVGDVLTSVNGKEINTVEEMTKFVSESGGKELTLTFVRDGKSYKAKLHPIAALSDGAYRAGVWVRDSTAGIGTVTFYDPASCGFAGLGHGIYDADTDLLLPLLRGTIVDITLEDVIRGREGHPGELKGAFGTRKTGSLSGNTACGVFGTLDRAPETIYGALPCALKSEVAAGAASILCNVDGKGVKEYGIEIVKIYSGSEETKNFVIEVTDEALLAQTGGIVRGMSGSPILQNGKLVGAVTHVLVNEPKRGYGIFIENMLQKTPYVRSSGSAAGPIRKEGQDILRDTAPAA